MRPNSTLAHNVGQIPWEFIDYNKVPYIVESSAGDLLVIVREGHPYQLEFLDGYGNGDDPDFDIRNLDKSRIDYGTRGFRVLEMD